FTDGQPHRLALYCVDWKREGYAQMIEILDAANGVALDKQDAVDFQQGKYFVWTVQGNVKVRVTGVNGSVPVLSGIFFGAPAPPSLTTFVKMDSTTKGNWKGAYGSE